MRCTRQADDAAGAVQLREDGLRAELGYAHEEVQALESMRRQQRDAIPAEESDAMHQATMRAVSNAEAFSEAKAEREHGVAMQRFRQEAEHRHAE